MIINYKEKSQTPLLFVRFCDIWSLILLGDRLSSQNWPGEEKMGVSFKISKVSK